MVRLVESLIAEGIFKGMDAKKVRDVLYKRYNLGRGSVLKEKLIRYGPAVIFIFLANIVKQVYKELEKSAEESTKEI